MSDHHHHSSEKKIPADAFYGEYHGHKVKHLQALLPKLRASSDRLLWTAGDSSLDNKYWFGETAAAVEGAYKDVLQPPRSKQDVTYWLNHLLHEKQQQQPQRPAATIRTAAINTAVEATTLNERTFHLRAQDKFIRDNIREDDILIVSVGGNDVALMPAPCTIAAIGGMICCLPMSCIDNGFSCGVVPCNDCCCGCGSSFLSCGCACPPCLGYMRHLFGIRVQKYIQALTEKTKPSKILVCMIYYPDERRQSGWAGPALAALGYDTNPAKLQSLIRKGYQEATTRIVVDGTQVIPVPLFHALDGKQTSDYVQRVEPSAAGGRKMAEFLLDIIEQHQGTTSSGSGVVGSPPLSGSASPTVSYMRERS